MDGGFTVSKTFFQATRKRRNCGKCAKYYTPGALKGCQDNNML